MSSANPQEEIGGYIELETYGKYSYHKDAVFLNTGRNALKYAIRLYKIESIYVPYYNCPIVWEALKEENCNINYYDIDINFLPVQQFPKDAFVLVNNYFGVCEDNIKILKERYRNLIIDNAQSFYSDPCGIASFYSPRKFFGLPDGGILYCQKTMDEKFEKDVSFGRMAHLLKRHDLCAYEGYEDFKDNDEMLSKQPIKQMSKLTMSLMGNINHEYVRKQRYENFNFLRKHLDQINELKLSYNINAPMVYPLLTKRKELRKELISKKIYVAKYWEGVKDIVPQDSFSDYLIKYLIPLPIDQRYTPLDMQRIVNVIKDPN